MKILLFLLINFLYFYDMKIIYNNRDLKSSGTYRIKNIINNKFYIGSAHSLYNRYYNHLKDLKSNKHCNKYLQASFNKYGIENFIFEIMSNCPKEYCLKIEQHFIDNLKPDYNLLKIAGSSIGYKHPEHIRKIMSEKRKEYLKNNKISDITKNKILLSRYKPVIQFDLSGNFIKEHESILKAYEYINKKPDGAISKCCKGKNNKSYGYKWKYK